MKVETFELERVQSLWENLVEINLTESGVHPYTLEELLTPEEIAEVTQVRLGYGQTNGSIPLRESISDLYGGTDADNVLVTTGSAEANFVAAWNLLEPGDELALMVPNYLQLRGIARAFGVDVRPFHLRDELAWGPDLEELRAAISPRTRMIALCNPNNPTGAVLSAEDMQVIVDLAADVDAWVYVDEVYRGAELVDRDTPTFWGTYDKVVVNGGLSKAYALPGLRIGWLVGPQQMIADSWARHDYTTIASAVMSDRIAQMALTSPRREQIFERNRSLLRHNLVIMQDWVDGHGSRFHFIPPQAGGMAFIRYDFDVNSTELVTRLRDEKGLLVIAGDCFGMDRHLRIGIGGESAQLKTGLGRIDEVIDRL